MTYTPPVNPNVELNFVTTPFVQSVNPNVTINFGPESGGGTPIITKTYIHPQNVGFFIFFGQ